jgi:hypothetical protein
MLLRTHRHNSSVCTTITVYVCKSAFVVSEIQINTYGCPTGVRATTLVHVYNMRIITSEILTRTHSEVVVLLTLRPSYMHMM